MADSNDSSYCIESDDNSFLSGSVNYSTECSDDHSISEIMNFDHSILAEMEVRPYRFKPEVSDSESVGYGEDTHTDDFYTLSPE